MRACKRIWSDIVSQLYFTLLLPHIAEVLIEFPDLTIRQVSKFLRDNTFRASYVSRLQDRDTKAFWLEEFNEWSKADQKQYSLPLISRMNKLSLDPLLKFILSQREDRTNIRKIDFRQAIEEKRIILINLPLDVSEYQEAAPIIGTFLLSAIYEAAFSFADRPEEDRPGFTLIVDEFDNFATPDYERFFTKARSFKVKQFLAHQYRHQLDREGMGTNKQATLSAHTVIGMKTTPEDAKDKRGIAGKFEGLKRRPTDIYIDVLDRLKTRRNPLVKEFYLHTVTSLQTASKMKIGTSEDRYGRKINVRPQFDFGFGTVSFDPENVASVLTELNNLFYYSQKGMAVDEARKPSFIKAFGNLNGIKCTEGEIDYEAILHMVGQRVWNEITYERLQKEEKELEEAEKQAKLRRHKEREEILERQQAENRKRFEQDCDPLYKKLKQIKRELDIKNNFSSSELAMLRQGDEAGRHLIRSLENPEEEDPETLSYYFQEKVEFIKEKRGILYWFSDPVFPFDFKEYIELHKRRWQLNKQLEERTAPLDEKTDRLSKTYWSEHYKYIEEHLKADEEDRLSDKDQKLKSEHKKCKEEMWRVTSRINELSNLIKHGERELKVASFVNKNLIPVIEALIKDPIASDKPPEIDEILINLKQRHALVNKGSAIYEMETIDLNNGKREEEEKKRLKHVYDSRIGSIRERTRSTYCRSRKVVEQQIYNLPDTKVTPQDDTIEIEDEEEETKRLQQKYRELLNKPPTSQENTRKEKPEDSKSKNTDDDVDWQPYEED